MEYIPDLVALAIPREKIANLEVSSNTSPPLKALDRANPEALPNYKNSFAFPCSNPEATNLISNSKLEAISLISSAYPEAASLLSISCMKHL